MTHSTEMHAWPLLPDSTRKQRWGMRNQPKQSASENHQLWQVTGLQAESQGLGKSGQEAQALKSLGNAVFFIMAGTIKIASTRDSF